MDLSKKCSKALEIQDLGRRSKQENLEKFVYEDFYIDKGGDYHDVITDTWLPQQDQLQVILSKDFENAGLIGIMYGLAQFSQDAEYEDDGNTKRFSSLEQLWLGYVMKEQYDKYWHNNDWRERYEGY